MKRYILRIKLKIKKNKTMTSSLQTSKQKVLAHFKGDWERSDAEPRCAVAEGSGSGSGSGRLLKLFIHPWSVELGNVLTEQILTIQWECGKCKLIHKQDATSLVKFSTKKIELDLQNLKPLFCSKCTQFVQLSGHLYY